MTDMHHSSDHNGPASSSDNPTSLKNAALMSGASMTQDLKPVKKIGAHLHAFHAYADEPSSYVETNHYCSHLNDDIRQCILYDSDGPGARLIGVEYMIKPHLYENLPPEERRLWHSHVFEVKSGMLIMPNRAVPGPAWEVAERVEMEQVVELYGKVYHLWQTDKGHELPLGEPKLMTSFTSEDQLPFDRVMAERDRKFGVDWRGKRDSRRGIPLPEVHPDADQAWKR